MIMLGFSINFTVAVILGFLIMIFLRLVEYEIGFHAAIYVGMAAMIVRRG